MKSQTLIQSDKSIFEVKISKSSLPKQPVQEYLAEETPVAMVFNGISHVVMMASPADFNDFAHGFAITEKIVSSIDEIYSVNVVKSNNGVELEINISTECFEKLKEVRRNLTGRTGCGLCGAESLNQVINLPENKINNLHTFSAEKISKAMEIFASKQEIQSTTGATHACALCSAEGEIKLIREDVGRHNALDKLIGAILLGKKLSADDFILISSRASYEMIQKFAYLDLPLLVAISAPTALAVRLAENLEITLLGFARSKKFNIYSHEHRITR